MRLRNLIPYILLAVLPCVLLFPILTGQVLLPANLLHDVYPWRTADPKTLVPWNVLQFDGIAEFYPWRLLAAETWRAGYVPLWNPYEFCGTPFLANSQSAVLYPLNILFVLMPVAVAFGVSALVHLFLTGAFLYLFLRRSCGLTIAPALLGASAWQLSTWQVSWLALPTFLDTSCWLPLALLLTDRLAERPTFARAGALGLMLGVMLLAGHLQIALYCLLLVIAFAIFCVIRRRTPAARAIGCALLSGALMIMVAAPQLLPVVELSRVSHRAGTGPTATGYTGYVGLALPARHLATLFLPNLFGRPDLGTYWDDPRFNFAEVACYVGVGTLILAVLGAVATWRGSKHARFFVIAAVVALLMALGTPLDALLYFGIPGFGQTGSPARILVLWTLCLAVLAGFGAEAILARSETKKAHVMAAFAGTAILFGATFGGTYAWLSQNAPAAVSNLAADSMDIRVCIGIFLALGAIAYFTLKGSLASAPAGALLILVVAADLVHVGFGYNPTVATNQVYPKTPLVRWLAAQQGPYRIMPVNHSWSLDKPPNAVLPPNAATAYGLAETQGYDSLQTGQYMNFAYLMDGRQLPSPLENGNIVFTYGAGSREAREAGARYVISLVPLSGLGQPVFNDGTVDVYEDAGALPLARTAEGAPVKMTQVSPTRIDIEPGVNASVVLAQQWYPGWTAEENGKSLAMREGPDVLTTVSGGQGPPATVHLLYQPAAFRMGLYLCFAALLALSAAGVATLTGRQGERR